MHLKFLIFINVIFIDQQYCVSNVCPHYYSNCCLPYFLLFAFMSFKYSCLVMPFFKLLFFVIFIINIILCYKMLNYYQWSKNCAHVISLILSVHFQNKFVNYVKLYYYTTVLVYSKQFLCKTIQKCSFIQYTAHFPCFETVSWLTLTYYIV